LGDYLYDMWNEPAVSEETAPKAEALHQAVKPPITQPIQLPVRTLPTTTHLVAPGKANDGPNDKLPQLLASKPSTGPMRTVESLWERSISVLPVHLRQTAETIPIAELEKYSVKPLPMPNQRHCHRDRRPWDLDGGLDWQLRESVRMAFTRPSSPGVDVKGEEQEGEKGQADDTASSTDGFDVVSLPDVPTAIESDGFVLV